MKVFVWLAVGALCVGNAVAKAQESKKSSASATQSAQPATSDASYKIGAQDVLRIDVWKEPELSRQVPVRPDGRISLPLLNDVEAAGLTAMELANSITEGLKKYITDPRVTVTVTEINSRRVYVNGEVTRPGAFPLLPNMTALQALTSAGGFTQFARIRGIYILRNENGKQTKKPYNYKDVVNGHSDDVVLQPGDTIVVP